MDTTVPKAWAQLLTAFSRPMLFVLPHGTKPAPWFERRSGNPTISKVGVTAPAIRTIEQDWAHTEARALKTGCAAYAANLTRRCLERTDPSILITFIIPTDEGMDELPHDDAFLSRRRRLANSFRCFIIHGEYAKNLLKELMTE